MSVKRHVVTKEEFHDIMHGRQKAIIIEPSSVAPPKTGDMLHIGLEKEHLGPPTLECRITNVQRHDDYENLVIASINRGMDW